MLHSLNLLEGTSGLSIAHGQEVECAREGVHGRVVGNRGGTLERVGVGRETHLKIVDLGRIQEARDKEIVVQL